LFFLQGLADLLFVLFAVGWLIFRLTLFPLVVIHSAMFVSLEMVSFFRSWYLFNGLLVILLILHIYWFSFIVRIIYLKVVFDQDVRGHLLEIF
jgi:ceramide synthetase